LLGVIDQRSRERGTFIDHLCLGEDICPNVFAEAVGGCQIDITTEQRGKLVLYVDHVKQGDPGVRLELNQHIDITLRAKVAAQRRAIEQQTPDVVAVAQVS
jgi:hypothetical protein